jgi:hypothetical protein
MLESGVPIDAENVREHTRDLIENACTAEAPVLIEAPPNAGKSTSSYTLSKSADVPVTYFAGRRDLYEGAERWAEDNDVSAETIPSPFRSCPTFQNKNDGELAKAKQLYQKGYSARSIHREEDIYMPCTNSEKGKSCEYMRRREQIDKGLSDGSIDLLIGNHQHAYQTDYTEGRIVVLDEFNPDTFLQTYPPDYESGGPFPGDLISDFLEELARHVDSFPSDTFQDLTDILQHREDEEALDDALDWFEETGVSIDAVQGLDFYEITSYQHDNSHRLAPLLTLALLCMRKIGTGMERVPPPDDIGSDRLREAWKNIDGTGSTHIIRDRNSGKFAVLRPPDLTKSEQVIGLDGLPSKELWNLISEEPFEHQKVIQRQDFSEYLSSALKMEVNQIGKGRYPYAGGRISSHDRRRFEVIKQQENRPFALISTKRALEEYDKRGWIDPFVKHDERYNSLKEVYKDGRAVLNYGSVRSSNIFEEESFGVVSGSPFPGYDVLRRWAGLCGVAVDIPDEEVQEQSFEGITKEVYNYLNHHQVVQAVLRYGRDRKVWGGSGSVVYVNTTELPGWFEPNAEITVYQDTKETAIIEYLIEGKLGAGHKPLPEQSTKSVVESLSINQDYVREILDCLVEHDLVTVNKDKGANNCHLYEWNGTSDLGELGNQIEATHCLRVKDRIYLLSL